MRNSKIINRFRGKYAFLSNMYSAPTKFMGRLYPTSEHAYVASKTYSKPVRRIIQDLKSPVDAKRLGRNLIIRSDWEEVRLDMMTQIVRSKFSREEVGNKLIDTYPSILIEGNTWGDIYWGMCEGVGQNHLGRILMKIRDEIR